MPWNRENPDRPRRRWRRSRRAEYPYTSRYLSRNLEEYDDISQRQGFAPTDYSRTDFEGDWATIGRENIGYGIPSHRGVGYDRDYSYSEDDADFYSDYGHGQPPDLGEIRTSEEYGRPLLYRAHRAREGGGYWGRGPKGYTRADSRILEDVSDALMRHPEIDASQIEVSVHQGEVVLKGFVDNRRMKRLAEDEVENILGVTDVNNQIRVSKPQENTTNQDRESRPMNWAAEENTNNEQAVRMGEGAQDQVQHRRQKDNKTDAPRTPKQAPTRRRVT